MAGSFANHARSLALVCFASFAATACSPGGSGGGAAVNAPTPSAASPVPAARQAAPLKLSVKIPAATASAQRSRQYISPAVAGLTIAVWPSIATPPPTATAVLDLTSAAACGGVTSGPRTCSVAFQAPVGNVSLRAIAYDKAPVAGVPQGNIVGQTTYTQTANILASGNNAVNIALGGVPASLQFLKPRAWLPSTGSLSVPLVARDADGFAIFGLDAFPTPISITKTDPGNLLSLGTTALNTPSDAATGASFSYVTSTNTGSATVTATSGSATASLAIDPAFYIYAGTSAGNFGIYDPAVNGLVGAVALSGSVAAIDTTGPGSPALATGAGYGFFQVTTATPAAPIIGALQADLSANAMIYGGALDGSHAYGITGGGFNQYNVVLSGSGTFAFSTSLGSAVAATYIARSAQTAVPDCYALADATKTGNLYIGTVGATPTSTLALGTPLTGVAVSKGATSVAAAFSTGTPFLSQLNSGCATGSSYLAGTPAPSGLTGALAYSPDGNTLYAATSLGISVIALDSVAHTQTQTTIIPLSGAGTIKALDVNSAGTYLVAAAAGDSSLRLIDLGTKTQIAAYPVGSTSGTEVPTALKVQAR